MPNRRGRVQADRLADFAHRRRVAAPVDRVLDHLDDAALTVRQPQRERNLRHRLRLPGRRGCPAPDGGTRRLDRFRAAAPRGGRPSRRLVSRTLALPHDALSAHLGSIPFPSLDHGSRGHRQVPNTCSNETPSNSFTAPWSGTGSSASQEQSWSICAKNPGLNGRFHPLEGICGEHPCGIHRRCLRHPARNPRRHRPGSRSVAARARRHRAERGMHSLHRGSAGDYRGTTSCGKPRQNI